MDEVGMVICDTCFCVVEASKQSLEGHLEWHAQLVSDNDEE